jgi:hypothetical protein
MLTFRILKRCPSRLSLPIFNTRTVRFTVELAKFIAIPCSPDTALATRAVDPSQYSSFEDSEKIFMLRWYVRVITAILRCVDCG